MTVAIGLVCQDGVIVASDSQGTTGNVALVSEKVHVIDGASAIWTTSGSVYVAEEVKQNIQTEIVKKLAVCDASHPLRRAFEQPIPAIIRGDVADVFKSAMQRAYNAQLQGNIHRPNLTTGFLLLGVGESCVPYFLEIDADGTMNWHTTRGFFAIGSGGEFATVAHALMQHYLTGSPIPLEQGKQLAYRTIETTCQVSARLVGGPVQMAIATRDGARILPDTELNHIGDAVNSWKELERNTLRQTNGDTQPADTLPDLRPGRLITPLLPPPAS